ncbi:uncharacterized protein CXQ87_001609 [Candidozyma duobushaemuli]|uniref:BAR domain-containing protein n=2 Tax=Candidozyma TaxID=3303203 RepID=A0ABX8I4N3_9ASCO|nr:uncharacterized protein CXQ87_001609 [[Candida] duobushaemulonis]PVH13504.1 hypothetical protein CXQ87_001609 [[Candida] duobushaemulonis]QWU88251.1 hypothetical protein CA3LBN_002516 [[Candida] haemuloni]
MGSPEANLSEYKTHLLSICINSTYEMSWSGFKKAINRAGNQVLLKAGQIDETVDLEFDYEEKRYRAMEKSSEKLYKELRRYKETLASLSTAQSNVSDVLAGFYGQDNEAESIAKEYNEATRSISAETLEGLGQPFLQTVLNPIDRFNSYYVDMNEAIKKRAHKKLDYDSLRNKVRKLSDNPDAEPASEIKLKDATAQLASAEEVYERLNGQLKSELPRLMDLRISYLNPSFEAFVKLQLRYFSENHRHLNEVQKHVDAKTRADFKSGKLEKRLDDILGKVKELNIAS